MTSKTTVAVDQTVRKKLKKLAAILDISQGDILKKALKVFEKSILSKLRENKTEAQEVSVVKIDVKKILEEARKKVWAQDPGCKIIQEKLQVGPETIDDFIINEWDSGLK